MLNASRGSYLYGMRDDDKQPLDGLLSRFLWECFSDPVLVLERRGARLELNRAAREHRDVDLAGLFDATRRLPSIAASLEELDRRGHAAVPLERLAAGRYGHFLLEGRVVDAFFVIVLKDESERRALEQELQQLRRVESLGLMTARVVHDLNNLLMPILCLSHQLLAEVGDASPGAVLVADIEKAAESAEALVQDVLAFSRPRPQTSEAIDVNDVIREMRPLLKLLVDERIEVVLELSADVGLVRINRGRLEQSILNLVANARHAMPEGGRLTISSANAMLGTAAERETPAPRYVMLSVTDDGVGMTEDVRSRAFEPFFTTRETAGGTGLGLSSVQRFARECGGLVSLDSRVGRGTTVSLYLPDLGTTAARR